MHKFQAQSQAQTKLIKVTPLDITNVKTVIAFRIMNVKIVLNQRAVVSVQLLDADNKIVKIEQVVLTGDDYKNWGNDDTYVNIFVCNKLGLNVQA